MEGFSFVMPVNRSQ